MLIVPSVTPFRAERVDHDTIHALTRYYVQHRVPALFPLGTTGEFPLLDRQERQESLASFVAAAGGELDVIAHIGATSLREVLALGEHAQEIGVRSAAVVTPYYFGYSQDDLAAFFSEVCGALPDLSVYAYTIPGRTGNTLDLSTVARLTGLPNLVGIKDSSGDMRRLLDLLDLPGLTVFAGADALALPFMRAGGAGLVSGLGSAIPEVFASFFAALATDDAAGQARTFGLIRRFDTLLRGGARLDFIRLALAWRGLDTGVSRAPLPQPSEAERHTLLRGLDEFAEAAGAAGVPLTSGSTAGVA